MQNKDHKLIPGEALVYERANGVVYARYRDPPHNKLPRWVVGGDPRGFINGTSIPRSDVGLEEYDTVIPDWNLLQQYTELQSKYKEFLEVQEKYSTWEKLSEQR